MSEQYIPPETPLDIQLQVVFAELTSMNDERLFLKAQNQFLIARVQELEMAVASMRAGKKDQPSAE